MNTRRAAGAVAALVAATAVAGCSDGGAASDTPLGLDTGKPKAAVVEKPPAYTELPDRKPARVDRHGQAMGQPAPGIKIRRDGPNRGPAICTLGPAVTVAGRPAFLTAGHCDDGGVSQYAQVNADDSSPLLLGPAVQVVRETNDPGADRILDDRALIYTEMAAGSSSIAGLPVAGYLTVEQTRELPVGTPICVDGAVSGVRCGGLAQRSGDRIRFDVVTVEGDSGAPVFLVSGGHATVIGILKGGVEAVDTTATFIEPALKGATLTTAP